VHENAELSISNPELDKSVTGFPAACFALSENEKIPDL